MEGPACRATEEKNRWAAVVLLSSVFPCPKTNQEDVSEEAGTRILTQKVVSARLLA